MANENINPTKGCPENICQAKTGFRWFVLALIFLVYMVAGADRSNIGMVVPYIKKSFSLSNTDIGAMASFFYLTYAFVQIPSGLFFGKIGVRLIFTFSVIFTSIATFIMGLSNSGFGLKMARALLGFAEGPINIGCITTINRWFPPQEKGIATGVFMSSIKFAPAFVPPLCAWIILTFGWRAVFLFFCCTRIFTGCIMVDLCKRQTGGTVNSATRQKLIISTNLQ